MYKNKKRLKVSQKGISDLISNILIISFVIIIAIILFSWSYNYFNDLQAQKAIEAERALACSDVYMAVKDVCYTKNRVEITLENQASESIIELIYRFKQDNEVFDYGVASRLLGVYSTKKYIIAYKMNKIPNSIELFPVINFNGKSITCSNLLKAENIKICKGFEVESPSSCGNGIIDGSEPCDGTNLGINSCSTTLSNSNGGVLSCESCDLNINGCRITRNSGSGGGGSGGGSSVPIATVSCPDADGDLFTDINCGGTDCNDNNNLIYPDAVEILGNGIDENCDWLDIVCQCSTTQQECINPLIGFCVPFIEICNDNLDNDCDGLIDASDLDCQFKKGDLDGDGLITPVDYNLMRNIVLGLNVKCYDINKNIIDCKNVGDLVGNDGFIGPLDLNAMRNIVLGNLDCNDIDSDGYIGITCGGTDCDNNNPLIYHEADEVCNGIDDNCNTLIDAIIPLILNNTAIIQPNKLIITPNTNSITIKVSIGDVFIPGVAVCVSSCDSSRDYNTQYIIDGVTFNTPFGISNSNGEVSFSYSIATGTNANIIFKTLADTQITEISSDPVSFSSL